MELHVRQLYVEPGDFAGFYAGADIAIDALGGVACRPAAEQGAAQAKVPLITAAVAGGLAPAVAITVTRSSLAAAPALATWLLEQGLAFTVSFYREHACGQGRDDLALEEARIIAGMRAIYAAVEASPPPWSVLGALLDRADLSHAHGRACAAGEHYMVIDHHGRVSACQMAMARPVATVADADPLGAIRLDPRLPLGLPVDDKEGCRSCEWRYWCGGGCPIATLRATVRSDLRSPSCAIYKALYPDLIRLEGRRLLRRAGLPTRDL
ncbi:MAG: SPASM domain-containing protein [Chloroflexales bacterium]|nr:SPASM domain-containing protein [Chloroflexales bacterium]